MQLFFSWNLIAAFPGCRKVTDLGSRSLIALISVL
jgi:hypothetical protein